MFMLIFILIAIIFVLFLILIKVLHELKQINKQTKIKLTTNAGFTIANDLKLKELNILCENLNNMYQKFAMAQVNQITKEKEFKEMLSYIAHDVRTPLTSIQGYLQILEESSDIGRHEVYYQIINKRLSDIKHLLEQFFLYSKLNDDDFRIHADSCDLYSVCCTSITSFYQEFINRNSKPFIHFEDKQIQLPIPKELLQRMFDNLIKNALDYGDGDFSIQQNGNTLKFSNAIRTPYDIDTNKVFDRFYKADNSRSHISSGLGLAIVQKMAHLMDAHVDAMIFNQHFHIIITFHHMQEYNKHTKP